MLCCLWFLLFLWLIFFYRSGSMSLYLLKLTTLTQYFDKQNKHEASTKKNDMEFQMQIQQIQHIYLMSFDWIRINLKSIEIRLVAPTKREKEREGEHSEHERTRVLKKYLLNFKFTLMIFFLRQDDLLDCFFFFRSVSIKNTRLTCCVNLVIFA